jgi:hypothetical protein
MTKEEKMIQSQINDYRKQGVIIEVHQSLPDEDATPDDGYAYTGETTISVAFADGYDAFDVADDIRSSLVEECDSGAGFGFRDLQLCRLLPNLK